MKLEKTSIHITLNTNNHIKPIKAHGFFQVGQNQKPSVTSIKDILC